MINVKRLTVISLCAASTCVGNAMPQTQETAIGTQQQDSTQTLPAQWNLQACIDYALQQNITIRKNRLNAESAEVEGYGIPDVYKAYKQERKYAAESK